VTGSSVFGPELAAKRLELLKESVARITRIAVLVNPASALNASNLRAMRAASDTLKVEIHPIEARSPKDFGAAFSAIAKVRCDAIIVAQDTLFIAYAKELAELALRQRLPTAGNKEFSEAGGLVGYGVNDAEQYRRGAYFVDKLLKGAKPSDLPIEQPTKFELVINIKTAKALGIKIPNSVLVQATKVIE
jgi:putative ABC transport system substrate-binding protein